MRALVCVHPNHDHLHRPFVGCGRRSGSPGDTPQSGRCQPPIKSRRRSSAAAGDTAKAGQTQKGRQAKRVSPPPSESQTDEPDDTDRRTVRLSLRRFGGNAQAMDSRPALVSPPAFGDWLQRLLDPAERRSATNSHIEARASFSARAGREVPAGFPYQIDCSLRINAPSLTEYGVPLWIDPRACLASARACAVPPRAPVTAAPSNQDGPRACSTSWGSSLDAQIQRARRGYDSAQVGYSSWRRTQY